MKKVIFSLTVGLGLLVAAQVVWAWGQVPKYSPAEMICVLEKRIERNNGAIQANRDNFTLVDLFRGANKRIVGTINYLASLDRQKEYGCRSDLSTGMLVDACPETNDSCLG